MSRIRSLIRRAVRRTGYDLQKRRPNLVEVLDALGVRTVLDVGANVGQHARGLRLGGYTGRIISFEPIAAAYEQLERAAASDDRWQTVIAGLGDADGEATINVSEFSVFSSLLPGLPHLREFDQRSAVVRTETIRVARLDTILPTLGIPREGLFLKLDVQGYEPRVLAGAATILQTLVGLQLEMSLEPMYSGQTSMGAMTTHLEGMGFRIVYIEPGVVDPVSKATLECDCVFAPGARAATAPGPDS